MGEREFNVEKLSARIRASAKKFGIRHDIEDCVQEILTRMLEGRHQHATTNQCVIDYLREKYGRTGTPGHAAKQALERAGHYEPHDFDRSSQLSFRESLGDRLNLDRYRNMFSGREIQVIELAIAGEKNAEIGVELGVCESRISQHLKVIGEKIKDFEMRESVVQEIAAQMKDTEGKRWIIQNCLRKGM